MLWSSDGAGGDGTANAMSAACRFCAGWPRPDHRIAELRLSVVALHEDQFFPGWTVLGLKRHVTELYELSQDERALLTEEVTTVARALAEVFQPRKMNYALLGNNIPHIHWHVIPRLASDPAPLETTWNVPHEPVRLGSDALAERVAAIRARLKA